MTTSAQPGVASVNIVLIVEPNMTGHRPYYVRLLAEEALRLGCEVIIATSPLQLDSDYSQMHLGRLLGQARSIVIPEWSVEKVAALTEDVGASLTIVPDGDRFAMKLALKGRWNGRGRLSILIMREEAQPARWPLVPEVKSMMRRILFRRSNSFSDVRPVVLKSAFWSGVSEFAIARDPVTLLSSPVYEERLTQEWKLTEDRFWFAILGAISSRKNVDFVARALSRSKPDRVGLLVAGAWDGEMGDKAASALKDLAASGARVVTVNRKLTDEELDGAVTTVDCVVLAHSNEGPSGLLGKAAAAGTRVVAAGAESLREDLNRMPGLGEWCALDENLLARALERALSLPRPKRAINQGTETFVRVLVDVNHTPIRGVQA